MNLKTITYDADTWQLVPKDIHPISSVSSGSFDFYQLWWSQLIAAAPQPETVSPWLPIETAPKDGTPFLVSGFNYGNDCGERWHDIGVTSKKGAVVSTINANNLAFATHWMPLPQPPETK